LGTPAGSENLTGDIGIQLTPMVLGVSPNVGSPAGSLITLTVEGVGINTQNLVVIEGSNVQLCSSINIVDYAQVQCVTKVATLSSVTLSVKIGSLSYTCETASDCSYSTSLSMPNVASVAL
jgi:hypothetical protein